MLKEVGQFGGQFGISVCPRFPSGNGFGHDDVSASVESVPLAYALPRLLEDASGLRRGQQCSTVAATEGDEVQVDGSLETASVPRARWQGIHKSRATLRPANTPALSLHRTERQGRGTLGDGAPGKGRVARLE